jgi:hypothetical protein
MVSISPTQSNLQQAVKSFLNAVLPSDVLVVTGVQNRVPEPQSKRFCVMVPIRFERLETNVDSTADCKFIGSITGTTMTVTDVEIGTLVDTAILYGTGVLIPNTTIIDQISGPVGGTGVYLVSNAQNLPSQVLSSGQITLQQNARAVVQLDFHTADTTAADLAQTVSTTLRDEFGVDFFSALPMPQNSIAPLYADDPRYVPFVNDQGQYEWRVTLDAHFQVNQIVSVPIEYADAFKVIPVSVYAEFPP